MEKLKAIEIAYELKISVTTLNNWYKWYMDDEMEKPDNVPELPKYEQAGPRATRYWKESDIEKIKKFQNWIPRGGAGVMGEQSAKYWGDRGIRALKNKGKI